MLDVNADVGIVRKYSYIYTKYFININLPWNHFLIHQYIIIVIN